MLRRFSSSILGFPSIKKSIPLFTCQTTSSLRFHSDDIIADENNNNKKKNKSGKIIIEEDNSLTTNTVNLDDEANFSAPVAKNPDGTPMEKDATKPEEVTSFLNQFRYAGAELGLKLSPPDMAVELLEYQKEGVGWMARREFFYSGGIMADFLGMGKTVQLLALCLARQTKNRPQLPQQQQQKSEGKADKQNVNNNTNNNTKKKSNNENDNDADQVAKAIIAQQKKIDKIGFGIHGAPFRLSTILQQLLQIPMVMNVSRITRPGKEIAVLQNEVSVIQKEFLKMPEEELERRVVAIEKEVDKWLTYAGKFYSSWEQRARAFLHHGRLKKKDGASSSSDLNDMDLDDSPEMRTLVIVPASLVYQWKSEIESKIDQEKRPCKVLIYHGSMIRNDKGTGVIDLESQDFVITTYESVVRGAQSAFQRQTSGIRKKKISTSSSSLGGGTGGGSFGLAAQISHDTMGSQIFNRAAASPLFRVRWKRIILDEAHYVRNEKTRRFKCIQHLMGVKRWAVTATPLHNSIQDLQTLLTFVGQPRLPLFEANESLLLKDPILQRAIARSLQPAFLRRTPVMTRGGVEHTLLHLPSKDDEVVRGDLTQKEVVLYNDSLAKRQNALSLINNGKGFIHVFAMMTLLRQACCHPWLTEGKKSEHHVCYLCNFETLNPITTKCGHAFCRECLHMAFKAQAGDNTDEAVRLPCPACQVPIPISILGKEHKASSSENINKMRSRKWVSSSKLDMLLNAIKEIEARAPDDKIVVFAQFTSLLDIVTVALEKTFPDTGFVRIDGSMTLKSRNGLIHSFTFQKNVKILLASKMAMGVGLNLTAANHVIILDPWWNPQVEEQAVHRCHRISQKKHVTVQRFVMNGTIEQYCYEISKKKKDFGDAVLKAATSDDEDNHASSAKTVAEIVAKQLKPIRVEANKSTVRQTQQVPDEML